MRDLIDSQQVAGFLNIASTEVSAEEEDLDGFLFGRVKEVVLDSASDRESGVFEFVLSFKCPCTRVDSGYLVSIHRPQGLECLSHLPHCLLGILL